MTYLTPEQRSRAIIALCDSTIFPDLREHLDDLADDLTDELGLPASVLSVALAELLREGMKIMPNDLAGRAEADGATINSLAEAIGLVKTTNYRRKMVHARDFAEAYRASRLTGVTIPVTIGEWTFEVKAQHN